MAIITSGLYDPYAMKGIRSVFSANLNNEIQDNLIEWLDWTLLQKGNYFNIDVGETAPNGQDMSRMRLSSDERYHLVRYGKDLEVTGFGRAG